MKNNLVLILCLFFFTVVASARDAADDQCNENYQKVYLAKRSCILNNDQSSCQKLGLLSSMYPLVGGAAGAFAAKMWTALLEKRSDVPNAKVFIEKLKAVVDAREIKAEKIISKFTHSEDAQKEVLGRTFGDQNRLQDYLETLPDDKAREFRSRLNQRQGELWKQQINQAIASTKDTLVKEALEEIAEKRPYKSTFEKVLKDQFGSDFDKVRKLYYDNLGSDRQKIISQLSPKERIIFGLMDIRGRESLEKMQGFKDAKAAQTEQEKRSTRIKTGGIVGGMAGALAPFGIQIGANLLDKRNLGLCKKELGLTDSDIATLNGNSYVFSEAKAKSSAGLYSFTCSKLKIEAADETLTQIKLLNDGQISPGICKIMRNEMEEMDSSFESINSVRTISCDGFKAANLEMTGSGFQKTFGYYLSGDTKVEAPFDGKNGWPDYTQAKVFVNGSLDKMKTEDFISRHQRYIPADLSRDNPNPRWDLKEMVGCLDSSKTSTECKMQRAAIASRLYYSNFRDNCVPANNDPTVAVPKAREAVR